MNVGRVGPLRSPRIASGPRTRWASRLALVWSLGFGCFGGGPTAEVEDRSANEFVARTAEFYRHLEGVPVDANLTYERAELRAFFATEPEYTDYYASLATQVRLAQFRDGRIVAIEVVEWRLVNPELAVVDLRLRGRHERELIFWTLTLSRSDTWRRVGGTWLLVPDKL